MVSIPEVSLGSSCRSMPLIGLGTAVSPRVPSETIKSAILHAIELGYRHFDTATLYSSEQPLGEAVVEALTRGLIKSRDELFITSKLWCSDTHHDRVLPAIQNTLQNLQLDYLDLYLIHWPVSVKPGKYEFPFDEEELLPMDTKAVWEAMEQCQKLGLAKAIGVSNFSCKKIELLLAISKIPPVVNQVELNPLWQQKKLREFCATNGIHVTAYSPLGARGTYWGGAQVMECDVLKEIAEAKGKSTAQVILRWVYEQGVSVLVKSFNEKRMEENLDILDWELNDEERYRISQIPQCKGFPGEEFTSKNGQYKSVADLWDGEI